MLAIDYSAVLYLASVNESVNLKQSG